jgi:hypothetical protein
MNRRCFLQAILASGVAPATVASGLIPETRIIGSLSGYAVGDTLTIVGDDTIYTITDVYGNDGVVKTCPDVFGRY